MAQLFKANNLNSKKGSIGSSKKKAKCVWRLLATDVKEIKIEANDLKSPLVFA